MLADANTIQASREDAAPRVTLSIAARLAPTQLAALAGECKKLIEDMTIFASPRAQDKHQDMIAIIANALQTNAITHGVPTPWMRAVAQCGEDLRHWAEMDWRVHGSYYETRFAQMERARLQQEAETTDEEEVEA